MDKLESSARERVPLVFRGQSKTVRQAEYVCVLPVLVDEESVSCYPLGMHTSSELLASTCRAFVSLTVELVCFGVLLASNASLLKAARPVARAICDDCCCLVLMVECSEM